MPAFPGFHDHGRCSPLRTGGWDARKGDLRFGSVIIVARLYLSVKYNAREILLVILSARPVLGRYHYDELPRCSPPRRGKWGFSLSSPAWKKAYAAKQENAGESRVGRSSLAGGRLRGERTAVKISCLLGRSRLRRKRGRLFVR